MRRCWVAAILAVLAALALSASASAAVTLSFSEAKHVAASVNEGDEYVGYLLKLKNAGTEPTSGTTQISVALPPGLKLANGSGWTCNSQALKCSTSSIVAPGEEFPPLTLEVWIFPEQAPDTVEASFTASGGGSSNEPTAQVSFTFGPAATFGLSEQMAGACTEPPSGEMVKSCAEAEEKGAVPFTQAGGHPYAASSSFAFGTHLSPRGKGTVVEGLRDLFFELPAGFLGNPEAIESICTVSQVRETSGTVTACPETAAVGGIGAVLSATTLPESVPLYRVYPEEGYVAAFAFRPIEISLITVVIRIKVRSNGDYGVSAIAPLPPQEPEFLKINFATLCGYGGKTVGGPFAQKFAGCKPSGQPGSNPVPFLSNQTRCAGGPPVTKFTIDSYQHPALQTAEGFPNLADPDWQTAEAASPPVTGCEALTEAWTGGDDPGSTEPSLSFQPDTGEAAAPAAYSAHLHIPQPGLVDRDGLATAHLKDTILRLPEGLALNPSAADGLSGCSEADVGVVGKSPLRFSSLSPGCSESSKLGRVEATTPLLDKPLQGWVYLAAQDANAVDSRFAIYLVLEDEETGIVAKLAGRVEPDAETGRITATFADNPQVPVEDLTVDFFSGPRASLSNPDVCGSYTSRTELTPWSAADPESPAGDEIAISESTTTISQGPGGGPCAGSKAARPFAPGFAAGSASPIAGAHSPFTLRITRRDGEQELRTVTLAMPPGFAATLAGVGSCSEGALAGAGARSGKDEIATPSCPANSQVGTTTIGAGAGSDPIYVSGRVYLAGPYKGAPLSLAFVVPAVAGPFDLGVQVVRTALRVNPKTAQITAESDPIPLILDGVPLQVRDVRVDIDRNGFTLNPTSCEAMAIAATVTGASGAVASPVNRFQVGACEALGFKPKVSLRLKGKTRRGAYQQLTATVTARPGDANIARAAVTLPHSAFLAQEHIGTICTRVQFAAKACPPRSVYGFAEAVTPLLDKPLSGPVYLRSSDNPLPDLVAALRGPDEQPIEIELAGRTDSKNEGIRNTFDLVPDAAVTKFTLRMMGGSKSLIVNSRDLCKGPRQRATVRLNGQNGAVRAMRPVVQTSCRRGKAAQHKRAQHHNTKKKER